MWGIFWPGRRRLNEQLCTSLRAAEAISQRLLLNLEPGRPSPQYMPQDSVHKYETIFWDFARAAVIFLGGRVGQERETRLIAGVISFIVGLASSYFIGRQWMARAEAKSEEMRVAEERRVLLPSFRQYRGSSREMALVKKILAFEEEIYRKIKRQAEYSLVVRIGLFVASLFGIAGSITSVYATLTVGVGIGGLFSIAWLVSDGFDFAVSEQNRSAQKLQEAVNDLRTSVIF